MNELDMLRGEIRTLDAKLIELVHQRIAAAQRIGEIKRRLNQPLQNFEIEKAVLDHALETGRRLSVHEDTVRALVRTLIEASLRVQERDAARRPPSSTKTALVVGGGGLMGNWFCRFLTEEGYRVFVDDPRPNPNFPSGKLEDRTYDLVLVATPPSTVPGLLESLGAQLPPSTLLLDISSVKGAAAPRLNALAQAGKKVASLHPMFGPGTELLMGKNVLVLDAGHPRARDEAGRLFAPTTASLHELDLAEHDALMAEVLGLAHATNIAFSAALSRGPRPFAQLQEVASTTFRKQTDVAREVARENPLLYYEIQALNPATDAVLDRLEASVRDLRRAVAARDEASFTLLMEAGRAYYGGA